MKKLILGMTVATLMAACASTKTTDADQDAAQKAAAEQAAAAAAAAKKAAADQAAAANKAAADKLAAEQAAAAALAAKSVGGTAAAKLPDGRTVYFDFDQSTVKEDFKSLVEGHAAYLQQNGNTKVTVEGHADERGSREYNIGLGQRRAEAVRKMMTVLGVQDKQVETVSYGEERAAAKGHSEEAWSKNRRAEIVYPKQ